MRKYIIGTGWYCQPNREFTHGSPATRTVEFHELWKTLLFRYANPSRIVVVDSASPVPLPADDREHIIRLDENYQGREREGILHDGWMRSFLLGAAYAWNCQADFIYVEQDCLVLGVGWVDRVYAAAAGHGFKKFLVGAVRWRIKRRIRSVGWSLQQSLVMIPREMVPAVVHAISAVTFGSAEKQMSDCGVPWAEIPFGYGRLRPLPVDEPVLYAQHLTGEELQGVLAREGLEEEFSALTCGAAL